MKPFNTLEEAKAELRDMPVSALHTLSEMTTNALDAGAINQTQYDFVMGLVIEEAMARLETAVTGLIEELGADFASEGETIH
jgi:hypothetical protein